MNATGLYLDAHSYWCLQAKCLFNLRCCQVLLKRVLQALNNLNKKGLRFVSPYIRGLLAKASLFWEISLLSILLGIDYTGSLISCLQQTEDENHKFI